MEDGLEVVKAFLRCKERGLVEKPKSKEEIQVKAERDAELKSNGYNPSNHPWWMDLEYLLLVKRKLHEQHVF